MDITKISFDELPRISFSAKMLVNSGRWRLYRVSLPQNDDVKYILFTESDQYLLRRDGEAESIVSSRQTISVEYECVISFSK